MSWQTFDLGDLVDIYDGPHATPKTTDRGPIFLGIDTLDRGRLNLESTRHVSEADYVAWTRRITPRAGDVVFSYETRLGEAALIPDGLVCCLGRRMGLMRAKAGKVDPHFLLYRYLAPDYQAFLATRTIHGATVDRLPLKQFPSFPISAPPIAEQRALAEPLRLIDEKIELNRRMNETLEAMAQAIFRDWFVDFGPVCRKLAGATDPVEIMGGVTTDPEQAAEMAGLFPSEMDKESVPTGWCTKPLEHIATFTKGRSYKSAELAESSVALVTLKSFSRGGGYRFDGLKPYTGEYKPNQVVGLGDIVMSLTDVTQAAELIGRPAIVSDGGEFTTLVASLDVMIIRAINTEDTPREYLFQALMDRRFTEHALAHTTGTTVLHLDKAALPSFEILVPPGEVARKYDAICGLFREKILGNDRQSQALAETRDYLLPRLMSGEVRVAEAEKRLEAVA